MTYRVDYRYYRRPFKHPLRTSYGTWSEREGIILRVTDPAGRVGVGEIAPLPMFGSESLERALAWCETLKGQCSSEILHSIPTDLPACQFGFESAIERMAIAHASILHDVPAPASADWPHCRLLPTGHAALDTWKLNYQQGDRTFKWKIGVAPLQQELTLFQQLSEQLPADVWLRLDANGGLSLDDAHQWLAVCDRLQQHDSPTPRIEFIEQPLPPAEFDALLQLSHQYQTPIALDESVATVTQLHACHQRGWRGIVVIKAAIAGYPSQVRECCRSYGLDAVWSSVFETAIARQYILNHLIPSVENEKAHSYRRRALGFGTQHYFKD